MALPYIPPVAEGYPGWVKWAPVDPATLTPNKTITTSDNIFSMLMAAEAGDIFLIEDGTHTVSNNVHIELATEDDPVTIIGETPGSAIIQSAVSSHFISWPTAINLRFIDLVLDGSTTPVNMSAVQDVLFQNVEFRNASQYGMRLWSGSGVVVSGCTFHDNDDYGVICGIKDSDYLTGVIYEGSEAYDNGVGGGQDGFNAENYLTSSVLIRDCVSHGNGDAGFDIKPNCDIRRCLSYGNGGSGFKMWRGPNMVSCLAYNNGLYQITLPDGDYSNDRRLINCSFHHANYAFSAADAYSTPLYVWNCIIQGPMGIDATLEPYTEMADTCVTQSGWWTGTGSGNIVDDPEFTAPGSGDFTLQGTSPCIGQGSTQSEAALDLNRATRVVPYDMGAIMYGEGSGRSRARIRNSRLWNARVGGP